MLLPLDGSQHQWFQEERWYDLLLLIDDATSDVYYAPLVEAESTRTVMAALPEVIEEKGLFCALYSDRASHFFLTPKAGQPVDHRRLTQVGRALKELGIPMIPAYSPPARGRSERNFRIWQGRLPQQLRLAGIKTVEPANRFLRERYIAEVNRRFAVPAAQPGNTLMPADRRRLPCVFSLQQERTVNRDNTVSVGNRILQIDQTPWRTTLAGCRVLVYEHLDGTLSLGYGPHLVGRYTAEAMPLNKRTAQPTKAVEQRKAKSDSRFPAATMRSTARRFTARRRTG